MIVDFSTGADVNMQNELGMSPLHWAVQVQSLELVHLLIEARADVTLKDSAGKTALDLALQNSDDDNETIKTIAGLLLSLTIDE